MDIEALIQAFDGSWLHFTGPSQIVQTADATCVAYTIKAAEERTRTRDEWAVGFLTFEAGGAFGLRVHPSSDLPVVWFAVFRAAPTRLERLSQWCSGFARSVSGIAPTMTADVFKRVFDRVKTHIADGDTCQANYTFRLEAGFSGDPRQLLVDLAGSQGGRYSAFIRMGHIVICSASPELFFRRVGRELTARPMKGTAPRGRTLAEDHLRRDQLRTSLKERAENVMIVDMMRNDVGRIASFGSVSVAELLSVERYPTVWQMTSCVTARTDASLARIFAALHPSASVTGAPKVKTMEILAELEPEPRGIYTGAVGYIEPGGDAQFNVAIRTALVDERLERISYGVGSGIVWDSSADAEYEESLLKGAVLGRVPREFELLETLRWSPGDGFFLLDRHLRRLRDSAEYFGFEYHEGQLAGELSQAVAGADGPLRIRLRLANSGAVTVECTPLRSHTTPARVKLSAGPVGRDDVFLYHKTTNRAVYDTRSLGAAADDVILWNAEGEVTESTIANVVVGLDGARVTPPVASGLLAGTFRAELLDRGEISERVVTLEDLRRATRIWLINSVQGWRSATLID